MVRVNDHILGRHEKVRKTYRNNLKRGESKYDPKIIQMTYLDHSNGSKWIQKAFKWIQKASKSFESSLKWIHLDPFGGGRV
jgi:hypothetical protein